MKLKWSQTEEEYEATSTGNELISAMVCQENGEWMGMISCSSGLYKVPRVAGTAEEMKDVVELEVQRRGLVKWLNKVQWEELIQKGEWLTEDDMCRYFGNEVYTHLLPHPNIPGIAFLFSPFEQGEMYIAEAKAEDGRMWYFFSEGATNIYKGEWILALLGKAVAEKNEGQIHVLEQSIGRLYAS